MPYVVSRIIDVEEGRIFNETGDIIIEENVGYYLYRNMSNVNSLMISGSVTREGRARVFLTGPDKEYLVLDSGLLDARKRNTSECKESIESDGEIDLVLRYKNESSYDADDDGVERLSGIIDFSPEDSIFREDIDEEKLCTSWEIHNTIDHSSEKVCYGNERCCNFLNMDPEAAKWDDILYLSQDRFGAGIENKVMAQIVYVDYSLQLEDAYSNIYFSETESLCASFYEERMEFDEYCLNSCNLSLAAGRYNLTFEIDNATIWIGNATFDEDMQQMYTEDSVNQPVQERGLAYDRSMEIKHLREANSKSYENPDGKITMEIFTTNVHYKNNEGVWDDINVSIEKVEQKKILGLFGTSSSDGYEYAMTRNVFRNYFDEDNRKVRFEMEDSYAEYSLMDSKKGGVNIYGNKLVYNNTMQGIDLVYTIMNDRLKEEIIIRENSSVNVFTFKLDTNLFP
jgi:hypothetical protein